MTALSARVHIAQAPVAVKAEKPAAVAPAQRIVLCQASRPQAVSVSRRNAMAAGAAVLPAVFSMPAFALIPDDDDEELLERAKARRAQRLKEELATERSFVKDEGFKSKTLDTNIAYVQNAVVTLSKAGAAIDSGDLSGMKATLGEKAWLVDLKKAIKGIAASDAAKKDADTVLSGIASLSGASSIGAAKKSFVATAGALNEWAVATGIASSVKGL